MCIRDSVFASHVVLQDPPYEFSSQAEQPGPLKPLAHAPVPEPATSLQFAPCHPSSHTQPPVFPLHRPFPEHVVIASHASSHPPPYMSPSHAMQLGPLKPSAHSSESARNVVAFPCRRTEILSDGTSPARYDIREGCRDDQRARRVLLSCYVRHRRAL